MLNSNVPLFHCHNSPISRLRVGLIQALDLIKLLLPLFVLFLLSSCTRAPQEKPRVCATAPYIKDLPPFRRGIVSTSLSNHRSCVTDECDFRIERLPNGDHLVKLKAVRFVPAHRVCVTVFMAEWADVYDATGRRVNSWPYCYLMQHELARNPSFKPDAISYKGCPNKA